MNTDHITQSAPVAPPHYDLLTHPLVHHPHSPSYTECRDTLHNATDLLDLFGHIDIDGQSEPGELSSDAANALFWLIQMLKTTLRYVSVTLQDLQANQDQHHQQLKHSLLFRALQAQDEASQACRHNALEACLGIRHADIDAFIRLLNDGDHHSETPKEET